MSKPVTNKRLAISKANAQLVGVIAIASFIAVFCLVASNVVFSQYRYQAKVVDTKEEARDVLKKNIKNFDVLKRQYRLFDQTDPNVIGGSIGAPGDKDGANSKIVLDALPGAYDFPALTSSIEKVLRDRNLKIDSIAGVDDEVSQSANASSPNPQPIPVPFSFSISSANYSSVQDLISALQKSIRPMHIDNVEITGGVDDMSVTVEAHTYFQPSKNLSVEKKVVK